MLESRNNRAAGLAVVALLVVATCVAYTPAFCASNNLALLYAKVGRKDDAVRMYRKALQIRPNYARAKANLAKLTGGAN